MKMTIEKTLEILNTFKNDTNKKSDLRVYNCFIKTINLVKNHNFSENERIAIENKLENLQLTKTTKRAKNYIYKKHIEFKNYLKNEFSLIFKGHYYSTYMVLGMSLGTGVGILIGSAFGGTGISIGLSIGTGIGMAIGILIGSIKDKEAKKLNKVIG